MPPRDESAAKTPATADLEREPWICLDPLSQMSVFLAPQRGDRPIDIDESAPASQPARQQADCPFCSGNETLTPPDLIRLPENAEWQARVVPNRFPIVRTTVDAPAASRATNVKATRPAYGIHEVLIESPHHDTRVEHVIPETWATAWRAAWQRLAAFAAHPQLRWAMLFKNAGPRAGASLPHVHSQLVGLDFVPGVIDAKTALLHQEPQLHDRVIADARREGRIWAEAGGVVAFVPSAARQPFESCIMPCTAEPHFHNTPVESVAAVASLTQRYAQRLSELAAQADYNWWLHQPAFHDNESLSGWHWHLEIMPRLTQLAGFELGSGCHISTMPATEAAALLAGR